MEHKVEYKKWCRGFLFQKFNIKIKIKIKTKTKTKTRIVDHETKQDNRGPWPSGPMGSPFKPNLFTKYKFIHYNFNFINNI